MVNKGKIIFVNGYWTPGIIGRFIIRSACPKEPYWLNNFEKEAACFLGLHEAPGTHVYLDASSLIGIDTNGKDRYRKAFADYDYCEISNEHTAFTPDEKAKNDKKYKNFMELTKGMDRLNHHFYIITHSEGGAYGAGLAQLLINKGWTIKLILHLSTDEAFDFDTPEGPLTYQLGFTGRKSHKSIAWGDWVTSNYPIRKGVNKWGIAYRGGAGIRIHNRSRCGDVFNYVRDLQTVEIKSGLDKDGKRFFEQVPETAPNGTIFTVINGVKLRYTPK